MRDIFEERFKRKNPFADKTAEEDKKQSKFPFFKKKSKETDRPLKGGQKKIASAAPPKDKITKADFAALKNKKKKKKTEKMVVECGLCRTPITRVVETRDTNCRIKLKGFCETCNKPKVGYVYDAQAIVESGNMFNWIVNENNPVANPSLQQSTNPLSQAPAAPSTTSAAHTPSTTTPTASSAPAAAPAAAASHPALQDPKIAPALDALAKGLGTQTDVIKNILNSTQTLHDIKTPAAPAASTTTPSPSAQPQK
jgi:hypothetical protein